MGQETTREHDARRQSARAPRASGGYSTTLESGTRRVVTNVVCDEAHQDMEDKVARGECVVLLDLTAGDGFRLQWSAIKKRGQVHCQAWHRPSNGHWFRGPSFSVVGESLSELLELMQETR